MLVLLHLMFNVAFPHLDVPFLSGIVRSVKLDGLLTLWFQAAIFVVGQIFVRPGGIGQVR